MGKKIYKKAIKINRDTNNHDFVHVAKYTCCKITNLNINGNSFDNN